MIGTVVGGYEVEALVGEGPNGAVWRARHAELGKVVAIKTLPPDLAMKEADRERFVRGSKALARLDHPGIATVYAAEFTGATPYMVSEFVEGQTVNARTAKGPVAPDQAVDLVLQAARALQYAHERGVIHRDISGGNIMITPEGRVKIVDFGLAVERDETRMTTAGTVLGTLPYMSPEALRDAPVHESRDTYALGVIFYQLVTGRVPFMADTFERLAYRVVNADAKPPSFHRPGLPAALDRLVLWLLEKNPKRRATNERLIAELQVLQASRVMRAMVVPPTRRFSLPWAEHLGQPVARGMRQLATMAPSQWRKLARRVTVSVASVGLLTWGAVHLTPQGPVKPKVASLAILPFFNENAEGSFDYIGHGLAEHVASRLAGLDGLLVQPYRRTLSGDAVDMTEKLNVEGVLEGSFAVRGGNVQVRVDLVKRNGHRETVAQAVYEGYKRAAEELAVSVAERLKSRLTPKEAAYVSAPAAGSNEAFDALSTAVDAHQGGNRDEALRWYGRAVSLDPGLAKAYVGIGSIYYDRYFRGTAGLNNLEVAESQFEQALALEPDNPGAMRGLILIYYERSQRDSLLAMADRVKTSNATPMDKLLIPAWAYTLSYFPEAAVPLLQEAVENDPQSSEALWFLVIASAWSRQFDQTISAGDRFFHQFGEDPEIHLWVAIAHTRLGHQSEATHHYQRALDLFSGDTQLYVSAYAGQFFTAVGERRRAQAVFRDCIRIAEQRRSMGYANLRVTGILAGLYVVTDEDSKATRELAYLDSIYTATAFVGTETAWWASMGYLSPTWRDRVVDYIVRKFGPHETFWSELPIVWGGDDLTRDPRVAPIAQAAWAYRDSLRTRHGIPGGRRSL